MRLIQSNCLRLKSSCTGSYFSRSNSIAWRSLLGQTLFSVFVSDSSMYRYRRPSHHRLHSDIQFEVVLPFGHSNSRVSTCLQKTGSNRSDPRVVELRRRDQQSIRSGNGLFEINDRRRNAVSRFYVRVVQRVFYCRGSSSRTTVVTWLPTQSKPLLGCCERRLGYLR